MRKLSNSHWLGLLAVSALLAGLAWGETLEMVTYYPAPGATAQDLHVRSLTVGLDYAGENPADGEALIFDRLGIGTNAPAGPLHVVGVDDQVSNVLFMPGADTGAPNAPELRVGIGTAAPIGYASPVFHVRTVGAAGNNFYEGAVHVGGATAVLGGQLSYHNYSSGRVSLVNLNDSNSAASTLSLGFGSINLATGRPNDETMTLTSAGNVGIGTADPQARLDVNGNILASGGMSLAGGNGDVNGDGTLAPGDTLLIINYLNGNNPQGRTEPERMRADVTGDGTVSSVDSLTITAALNARGGGAVLTPAERAVGRFALDRTLWTDLNRNLSIAADPAGLDAAPNGEASGNLGANDVWVRAANGGAGGWASVPMGAATGTYTGNAAGGPRAFNVGFRPRQVLLIRYEGAVQAGTVVTAFNKMPDMPADISTIQQGAVFNLASTLLNLTATGFTVGGNGINHTNRNTIRYDYIAYR